MPSRTFEFRPIEKNKAHPDWSLSDYCGPCRVIADDEPAARIFAANEFALNAPRGFLARSPWHNPELVEAVFVISGAQDLPPVGTVMMPAKGYPGFALGRRARRRAGQAKDE
jgi:hypothetical protein